VNARVKVPRRPLVGAAGLAAGLAAIFITLLVFQNDLPDMAVIAFFTPMISLFTIFVAGCIAFLAFGRYRVKAEPVFLWTGIACSVYSLMLAFHILLVPGLREGGGMIIGHSQDTHIWFLMLARILFIGLLFAAVVASRPKRAGRYIMHWFAAWMSAVGLACVLIVVFEDHLPDLIGPGGLFTPLETGGEWLLLPAMLGGAAIAIRRYLKSGERLFVYLGYLLMLLAFGTATNILAQVRFDFAWYIARIFPVVGFIILLLEFFWEYVRMYWSEQERSRQLEESVAERQRVEEALRDLNAGLEERVAGQTAEIQRANEELEARISERTAELQSANEELKSSRLAALNLMEDARLGQEREERVNRELIDTRNYLNNLLDYANAPIIVWDPAFTITLFNRAAERLTGYAAAEAVGRNLGLLFPEESKSESLGKIEQARRGEYWETVPIPILRRDGETRDVLWNSANVYAEDGKTLIATIAQGQDVTERLRAEAALTESERRFHTIVKHSPAVFFLQDMELRYRWLYNPKRPTADETVTGKTDFDLYAEEDARFLTAHKRRVLECGEADRLEFRIRAGESEVVQDIALEPYRDAAGAVRGVYGLSLDVTAQKRAEEVLKRDRETFERLVEERTRELMDARRELEQSKRLSDIGTLAATVAHELRNPLAAINIASYNIGRKARDPVLDPHLATIKKKVTESDQIINNLLFYSRIKYPRYERTAVDGLIAECLALNDSPTRSTVTIRQSLDGVRGVAVNADPLQLKEVFSNILNNAFDAVAEKNADGLIEVEGVRENEVVRIAIADNGVGIPPEDLTKLFEPFFTTKAKGTGLGLAVCRQIINLHGGSIRVDSAPGVGTTVEVHLPCCP
jgi:PAS domain S-box-containing protein